MRKFHPVVLSVLSGLLLYAGWPMSPFNFLLFIGFVPLLQYAAQEVRGARFFWGVYLAMVTWNATCTWWIWNSTDAGAIAAILVNSLFMSIPWIGYFRVKQQLGSLPGFAALICFWMSFEYIHQNWELTWPWLTLGNGFATSTYMIQWYSITGTCGGTLWVLIMNILVFQWLTQSADQNIWLNRQLVNLVAVLAMPIILSLLIKNSFHAPESKGHSNIVLVQPNIDPYLKFAVGAQEAQLHQLISLSESKIDSNTSLVIWPETALNLPNGIEEDSIGKNFFFRPVWNFMHRHPQVKLLSGVEGFRRFNHPTEFAPRPEGNNYFESYNAAELFRDSAHYQVYHKSKLVPGVEALPSFLGFMAPVFEQFGGTTGGYARQHERTVMIADSNGYRVAPAICYESIYGEFLTGYLQHGANLIAIITNDGWWGNTPGHHQHMSFARLRAIESRTWVARSANTGITCFIDPIGQVIDPQPWDTAVAIKFSVPVMANQPPTFYVKYGDLLSKISIAGTILLLTWSISIRIRNRGRNNDDINA